MSLESSPALVFGALYAMARTLEHLAMALYRKNRREAPPLALVLADMRDTMRDIQHVLSNVAVSQERTIAALERFEQRTDEKLNDIRVDMAACHARCLKV